MFYLYCFCILFILKLSHGLENLEGWNYINLHCRDNRNKPLDWWYIYKPPSDFNEYFEYGRNFSFITPSTNGRWMSARRHITETTMLHHTLSPLFRPTYSDNLAYIIYEKKQVSSVKIETSTYGILMADEMGGLFIVHSVPGLPDLTKDSPSFPAAETLKGHLLSCLSLDLIALNDIVASVKKLNPVFTTIQIPNGMTPLLPEWNTLLKPSLRSSWNVKPNPLDFSTKYKTIKVNMMLRVPGEKVCLYKKFAKIKQIMLDVYGPTSEKPATCFADHGVRNIERISVKFPEEVHYVLKKPADMARFAVSTAAHWQRLGGTGANHYWTCTSNLNMGDETDTGGVMLCVDDYEVWLSFDNFKVKEPICPKLIV